ncbi:MAG TPA: cobyrinic acid a,c-diamide synthase, partial [Shewanella frigidimarina]|nr:cobyrinic acid a,c-diamide synthase [Shewanella frigidimarina]
SVSINTAVALAEKGKRVLVLDADLGLANVDVMLGIRAEKNLSHVLS